MEWTDARWKEAVRIPSDRRRSGWMASYSGSRAAKLALRRLEIDAEDSQFAGGTSVVEVGVADKAADGLVQFQARTDPFPLVRGNGSGTCIRSPLDAAPATATVRVIVRDERTAR